MRVMYFNPCMTTSFFNFGKSVYDMTTGYSLCRSELSNFRSPKNLKV